MILSKEFCSRAPGLLGRLIKYIESDAIYSQPSLALGAALSLLSVLKGQRVQSQTGLRTNLLIVGLAPSGAGKGYGMKKIEKLLEACEMPFLLAGKPASHTGLLESLASTGRKLICWDEFGIALNIISNPKAPFYKAGIMQVLMDTYSKADSYYRGDEYKNGDNKTKRADIRCPNLSVYGLSTPDRFYEALQSANVIDGFLPRLMIFDGHSPEVPPLDIHDKILTGKPITVPPLIVEEILDTFAPKKKSSASLSDLNLDTREAKILPFSKDAEGVHFLAVEQAEKFKLEAPSPAARAVASRYLENFTKLCLTAEEPNRAAISGPTALFAKDIADCLVDTAFEAIKTKIHDSLVSKELSRLTDIIAEYKTVGVSKSVLTRRTQYLKPYDRKAALETLIDSERVEMFTDYTSDGQGSKRTIFYRLK